MADIFSKILKDINDVIEARDISQTDLAKKLKWHQPQLSGYLSGRVQIPIKKLEAILEELKIELPVSIEAREALRRACVSAILKAKPVDLGLFQDTFPHLFETAADKGKSRSSS